MEASKKKVLIIGAGVVLAGGLIWWYLHHKAASSSPIMPSAPTAPGAGSSSTVSTIATNSTVSSVPATIATSTTNTDLLNDPKIAQLQTWAQGSMNKCDLDRWNADKGSFTPTEWAGLEDLYFNDWQGGQGNTPARTQFWNDWRTKYSILTNTPC